MYGYLAQKMSLRDIGKNLAETILLCLENWIGMKGIGGHTYLVRLIEELKGLV